MVITPKFSVVVPVYNAEKYLDECVNSVLSQSVTDFELILVNDGSTDESGHICDRFALRDSRIKVIHQQNSGPIPTRFNGVKSAVGEYILSLDSDDYWLDGLLERVENAIDSFGSDILIFRLLKGDMPCHDFFGGEKENITRDEYFSTSLKESGMNSIVIKACKRSLFENVDISSVMSIRNSEDLLISTMLARKAEKISYIPDVLYFYRSNDTNISSNISENALDEYLISRNILWHELELAGLDNEENRKVFNTGFLRRAADIVLHTNRSSLPNKEKLERIRLIAEHKEFARIIKETDLSVFGTAKKIRLKLLDARKFRLLMLLDKIRSKI